MSGIRDSAITHPVMFALLATVILFLLYIVAGIVAAVVSTDGTSQQMMEALARLVAAGVVLFVVWRMEMIREARVLNIGSSSIWILAVAVIIYQTIIHSYAFFGNIGLRFAWSNLSGAVALNGSAAALLEEFSFRGAMLGILYTSLRRISGGALRSALITAAFFGASHVIRLAMGHSAPVVGLLVLDSFLAGIFYAGVVLRGRSLWPVVAIHLILNAYVGARAVSVPGFEETTSAWLIIILLGLPLPIMGLYLIHGLEN